MDGCSSCNAQCICRGFQRRRNLISMQESHEFSGGVGCFDPSQCVGSFTVKDFMRFKYPLPR